MAIYTEKQLLDLVSSNYKREIYSISYDELLKIKNDLAEHVINNINEAYDLTDGKYDELRSDENYKASERLLIIENNLRKLNSLNKYVLEEEERRSNIRELSILDFNDKYQDRTKNSKEVYEFAYSKLTDEQKALIDDATKNIRKDDLGYLAKIDKMDELFGPELITKSIDYINEKNIYNTEIRNILPEELLDKIPENSELTVYYKNIQEYMDQRIDAIVENNLTSKSTEVKELYYLFNDIIKNENSRTSRYYRDTVAMLPKNLDDRKMERFLSNVSKFETRMQGMTLSYGIEEIGYNKERFEKAIKERTRFSKKENDFDYGMAKRDRRQRRDRERMYKNIKLKIKAFPPKIKGIVEKTKEIPNSLLDKITGKVDYRNFYGENTFKDNVNNLINNIKNKFIKNKKSELTLAEKSDLVRRRGLKIPEVAEVAEEAVAHEEIKVTEEDSKEIEDIKKTEEIKNEEKEDSKEEVKAKTTKERIEEMEKNGEKPEVVKKEEKTEIIKEDENDKKENIFEAPVPEIIQNKNEFEKMSEKNNDLRWVCKLLDANHHKTNIDLGKHLITLSDGKNRLVFNYQTKEIKSNTFAKNEGAFKTEDYEKMVKAITTEQVLRECEIKYYKENKGKEIYETAKNIDLFNKEEKLNAEKFISKCLNVSFCEIDLNSGNVTAHSIKNSTTKIINFNINDTKAPTMEVLKPGSREQYTIENNAIDALINGFRDNEKIKDIENNKESLETKIEQLSELDIEENHKDEHFNQNIVAQAR